MKIDELPPDENPNEILRIATQASALNNSETVKARLAPSQQYASMPTEPGPQKQQR